MGFSDLIATTDRAVQNHLGSVTATYTPRGGEPESVTAMFDEATVVADPERPGVEVVAPVLSFRLEDISVDPYDDDPVIQVLGVDYAVRERIKDGDVGGMVRLMLQRLHVGGCG